MELNSQTYRSSDAHDKLTVPSDEGTLKMTRRSSEYGAIPSKEDIEDDKVTLTEESVKDEDLHSAVFKTTRSIIIEPSLVLCYMIHTSATSLITQYIYYTIGERYNLTAIMAAAGGNMTTGGSGSGCGNMKEDKNITAYNLQQKTQAEATRFNMYLDMITDIPSFFVILFFGQMMDHMGRKPMLILPIAGLSVRALLYILQQLLNLPLEVLLLSGVVEALTGGFNTYITAAYTVIIDTVSMRNRARRIAIADISFNLATALMSFTMGVMIEQLGFFWPFVLVLVCHLVNLIYIIFFVPETGKKTAGYASISPRYIFDCFRVVVKKREHGNRKRLFLLIAIWLVIGFATGIFGFETLYKLNSPFCWTARMLGTFAAVSSLVPGLIQMFLAAVVLTRVKEVNVILASVVSVAGSYTITGLATTNVMLWIAPFVGCIGGLYTSVLRSVISKLLPSDEQGSVFAFMQSTAKLMSVIGFAVYSKVYAATLYSFKGTIFLMMAGFMVICFILLIILKYMEREKDKRGRHDQLANAHHL